MTTTTLTSIRTGTYAIYPARSVCRFTVPHVFGLKPVTGTMALVTGTLSVASDPERSIASAEFDATTFTTDDPRRDRDIRGRRFLDTANHPEIGFRSTGVHRTAEGWRLTGVLTVRGGFCEVALKLVSVLADCDCYRLTASCVVDRVAAGVAAGRPLIGRHVRIDLDLYAVPVPSIPSATHAARIAGT
ncbi:YceI family protein [Actinoplanes sp. NPDC049802]|uniref:YceI family protein n=1 Tax=Actinoplanes sp. NPDC049802 TaxID=3154742 RepID=UPI00340F843A